MIKTNTRDISRKFLINTVTAALLILAVLLPGAAVSASGELTGNAELDPDIQKILDRVSLSVSIFPDVKRDDWAYEDIRKLADAKIVSGDGDPNAVVERPSFRPDATMTRAEAAVIIYNLDTVINGTPPAGGDGTQTYTDVPASLWSSKYIEATTSFLRGNTLHNSQRVFYPDMPITRGDFIYAVMKLSGTNISAADYGVLSRFTDDADINREWRAYAAIAVSNGILNGYDDGSLGLDRNVTRREICALTVRAVSDSYEFPASQRETVSIYIPDLDSGFYDTYFDGTVFVGDSVTMGLRNYVLNQRTRGASPLGDTRFLVAGSYGIRVAAGKFNPGAEVNLNYQGVEAPLEDCVARMGVKNVFLMLGMNDRAGATLPDSIEQYEVVVDKIYGKIPDANIFIQFCTPVTKAREATLLNNANTDKFNAAIVSMCDRRGIEYIDVATPMKDGQNAFKEEYASDGYVHMNAAGCVSWIKTLREFACEKYLSGEWIPAAGGKSPSSYAGATLVLETGV